MFIRKGLNFISIRKLVNYIEINIHLRIYRLYIDRDYLIQIY